jgi:phosphopantothenoylcysteine synthetase/decarboxylase
MYEMQPHPQGILYTIVCAGSSASHVPAFVKQAQEATWDVWVIATPQALGFIDIPLLEKLTGHPVRSEYRRPEDEHTLPHANAIVVFPATFNTLNKWALGISDTFAVGILCEFTGMRMPILAVPRGVTASSLDKHPAFVKSLETLRECGVRIIYDPEMYPPSNRVPYDVMLNTLDQLLAEQKAIQSYE